MKVKGILAFFLLFITSANLMAARTDLGGDDAGNGGFAYKQSIRILKMASSRLIPIIQDSAFPDLISNPEHRELLLAVLTYDKLEKSPEVDGYRGSRRLAMDYDFTPERVLIYKAFYESFAGTLDEHLEGAIREVQLRLVHEASHLWGLNEVQAEEYALKFMNFDQGMPGNRPDRPDITINRNPCVCLAGENINISDGECTKVCQKNITTRPVLFADFSGLATLSLNDWCFKELSNRHYAPSCWLSVFDGDQELQLPVSVGKNGITAELGGLKYKKTYIVRLVSTTGANSSTDQIYLLRKGQVDRPIKVTTTSRYSCATRSGAIGQPDTYSIPIYWNYQYSDMDYPMHLPNASDFMFCHDREIYGNNDSLLFPRLGLQRSYEIWSLSDPLFFDLNSDGVPDINDKLEERLLYDWNMEIKLDIFKELKFQRGVFERNVKLGYYLIPFVDPETGDGHCPTTADFKGQNPIYNVLAPYIGVDTEAIYFARSPSLVDTNGNEVSEDTLVLSKRELSRVWYTIQNGQVIAADDLMAKTHQIFFNWPFDYKSPLVKKSSQRRFRLVSLLNESSGPVASDKRFGCVPLIP